MRRTLVLVALAVVAAAFAGCGSTAAAHTPIVFGIKGGNIRPYSVSIQPNGTVRVSGTARVRKRQIPPATVRQLRNAIEGANLATSNCTTAVPDEASRYVRVGGATVTVRGDCEAPFNRAWISLAGAVGFRDY